MLNSQNSNFANSGNQTHNSRKSNSRKEKAQIGAKITSIINGIVSNGTEGGLIMDLYIRMERGPNGKWGVSWSKVLVVDSSTGQVPSPKPINSTKANKNPVFK